MRIRRGLVSNSSSTSFVVLIPEEMAIADSEWEEVVHSCPYVKLDKVKESLEIDDDDVVLNYAVTTLKNAWESLRQGNNLYEDWDGEESYLGYGKYEALKSMAREKDVIIASIDTSSDRGEIVGVTEEEALTTLNKR